MKNYKSKWHVGQHVWVIDEDTLYVNTKCDVCEGAKNIVYKGRKLVCPECKGKGVLAEENYSSVVREAIISKMIVTLEADVVSDKPLAHEEFVIWLPSTEEFESAHWDFTESYGGGSEEFEQCVFKTKEQAEKALAKKNKENAQ